MYLINYSTLHKISHVKILWTKWNWLNKHPFMEKSTVLFPLYNSIFKQPNVIQSKAILQIDLVMRKGWSWLRGGGSWILIGGWGGREMRILKLRELGGEQLSSLWPKSPALSASSTPYSVWYALCCRPLSGQAFRSQVGFCQGRTQEFAAWALFWPCPL